MQKQKVIHAPVDMQNLVTLCKNIIKDYPVDCVQFLRIKEQIELLESELREVDNKRNY